MRLEPTRWQLVVGLAAVSTAAGWALARLWVSFTLRSLPVPWLSAATLGVFALALLFWAWGFRQRLPAAPGSPAAAGPALRPISPFVAARTAALAMAASRAGAVVGGFYAGVAIDLLGLLDVPAARERLITAACCVLACLVIVLVALWLERMCRLPEPPEEPGGLRRMGPASGDSP